jgi:isoquinoline 1-oxidoreductase beta subunit
MSDQTSAPQSTVLPAGEPTTPKRRWRPSRRGFLIGLGVAGGALALGWTFGIPALQFAMASRLEGAEGPPSDVPTDPWAWFEVPATGPIQLYTMKVEMGQGIHAAMGQIAAEELGIPFEALEIIQASTARDMGSSLTTSGSSSVSGTYLPLRTAAATLRTMLTAQAAVLLGVDAKQLVQKADGFALANDEAQSVTYGEVAASKSTWEAPDAAPPLKEAGQFTVIGQPLPRPDIRRKVDGSAVYGYDARVEGMKYGAVLRPPFIGATLKSVSPGDAAGQPGVIAVVIEEGFAGVVAESRAEAQAAVARLVAEWAGDKRWTQAEIEALVTVGNGNRYPIQAVGDAEGKIKAAVTHAAEYRTPMAAHAHLEAQAGLVDYQPDKVKVWCSTQGQGLVRDQVARALDLKAEQVEVQPLYLGGGFGRKVGFEVAVEAGRLSRASGTPVHVGWTRTEDLRNGYVRPPSHHVLRAQLAEDGTIAAIQHEQASGDVAYQSLPAFLSVVFGADFGAYRGATIKYAIEHRQTIAWRTPVPLETGWWRGLGLLANTFAIESFIDELAHLAGADPLAYRLRHLQGGDSDQQRLARVIEKAAELANWSTPPATGRARGIAAVLDVGTVVAHVAEVSLDAATGKIRVHNVWSAMDCGLTINAVGARAQVEGNVMWGVGSALIEELTVEDGQIAAGNFDRYPLLTMKEAPAVEVALLEAGDGKPRGVGEPAIGPVAAAIANGVFALTGVRLRQLPFTPERVLAELASRQLEQGQADAGTRRHTS